MNSLDRYVILLVLAARLCIPASAQSDSTLVPPNIVLILVDDAGFMDFGAYGGKQIRLTLIDWLRTG